MRAVRRAFRFGVRLQGFGAVNYLNRHLDDGLIGRYVGPENLAIMAALIS